MSSLAESPSEAAGLRQLRTPRAAALAGVLFALLLGTVLILIRAKMPEGVADSSSWPSSQKGGVLTATVLMPFAGIAFLWFIAVVRDGFGRYEDRFFATVVLGSGVLFLATMFVATSVAAGVVASTTAIPNTAAHTAIVGFGKMVLLAASKTYGLRMAAVFMMSLATIWLKTGLMPGWLVGISYTAALALLIAADLSMWLTLAFPLWVLAVSALLLTRSGMAGR